MRYVTKLGLLEFSYFDSWLPISSASRKKVASVLLLLLLASLYMVRRVEDVERYFGSHAPRKTKLVVYPFMIVFAFMGYKMGTIPEQLVTRQIQVFTAVYFFVATFSFRLMYADPRKDWGQWWLSFPRSRLTLLGSRLFAFLSAVLAYFAAGMLCLWAGVAIRSWSQPIPTGVLPGILSVTAHAALLTMTAVVIHVTIQQIASITNKHPAAYIIVLPIFVSHLFGLQLLQEWLLPGQMSAEMLASGLLPDFWSHYVTLLAAGLPLAALCFWLGARYLNSQATSRSANLFSNK
ncbi:hypothetical protein ACI7RC_07360 [Brevibacillus sp. B_LB10_24]|uniref:hypothetical protein n=1 Tax=Brevibacillus sp. B_LB10_24 TaxID=3380645 RepID=UPI0038BD622B